MSNKILWVDDRRDPRGYAPELFPENNVLWATTYYEAINALQHKTDFDYVFLDNDLGDIDKQGKHVLNYIEQLLFEDNMPMLKSVKIMTSNPSAAVEMLSAHRVLQEYFNVSVMRHSF